MRPLFTLLLVTVTLVTTAQSGFPRTFTGHWKGEVLWYRPAEKAPRKFAMQLVVQPADTPGHYTWQITYGDKGEDNRPYLLKPVDTATGHWVVDERNGIVLDSYWLGNKLTSVFSLDKVTIASTHVVAGDQMTIEFTTTLTSPVSTTGHGTEDSPTVHSYAVKSYQKAVLHRQAQSPGPARSAAGSTH